MTYDEEFFIQEALVAARSAAIVLPVVFDMLGPTFSVIDIGCGTGAWADQAARLGMIVKGVDGHVPEHLTCIPVAEADLSYGYPCDGFDLAICLEVAEHLPPESAEPLIEGLAQARAVLFSAATPGQPGVDHINCKPHDYWHLLFERHGLYPTHIGPQFAEPVADFYRRNAFLYRRQGV